MVFYIIWEVYEFFNQFPIAWENAAKPIRGRHLGLRYPYFFHSTSLPSEFQPMVFYITWEIIGFSHQFPIAWKNGIKSIHR